MAEPPPPVPGGLPPGAGGGMARRAMWTLPNLLTLGRIVAVVPLVACIEAGWWAAAFAIFAAAALTDFLDGWIARRWHLTSEFGRFLDPLADKLIVAATVIAMQTGHLFYAKMGDAEVDYAAKPDVYVVGAIILREIVVSGLREFLGAKGIVVYVSALAKWKTAIQLLAVGIILFGNALWPYTPDLSFIASAVGYWGGVLLAISALLAWISAWGYFRAALPAMRHP